MQNQDSIIISESTTVSSVVDDPLKFYIACFFLLLFLIMISLNLSGHWIAERETQHRNWKVITSILMAMAGTLFLDGLIRFESEFEFITLYAVGGAAFGLINFFFWGPFTPPPPKRSTPVPGIDITLEEGDTFKTAISRINETASYNVQVDKFDAKNMAISIPYPRSIVIRDSEVISDLMTIISHFQGIQSSKVKRVNAELYLISLEL